MNNFFTQIITCIVLSNFQRHCLLSSSTHSKTLDELFWNQTFAVQSVISSNCEYINKVNEEEVDEQSEQNDVTLKASLSWMPQFLAPVTAQVRGLGLVISSECVHYLQTFKGLGSVMSSECVVLFVGIVFFSSPAIALVIIHRGM